MAAGDAAGESTERLTGGSLEGASNVLVLAPTMSDRARRSYFETLLPDNPAALDVLSVNYRSSPDQWLDEWQRYAGDRPRRCAIVSIEESAGSGADAGKTRSDSNTVIQANSPTDLTGLGITISQYLDGNGGPQTVITLESLTILLQYVDLQRAFRFLHVLANRTIESGSVTHYHMDQTAHDEQTVVTLESLFDAVAEFDDGEWIVRCR
jgi:hypothetical protein